jgi:hypothetical protein
MVAQVAQGREYRRMLNRRGDQVVGAVGFALGQGRAAQRQVVGL